MTELEMYKVIATIVKTVTTLDDDHVIPAKDNHEAPSGPYCAIQAKTNIVRRGQANIHRRDLPGDLVEVDVRVQLIAESSINFYRDGAKDFAECLEQANKRPDVSAFLRANAVGWNRLGPINDLTTLQSNRYEPRAHATVFLMYEKSSLVEQNNILIVPYELEQIIDGTVETLVQGEIQ